MAVRFRPDFDHAPLGLKKSTLLDTTNLMTMYHFLKKKQTWIWGKYFAGLLLVCLFLVFSAGCKNKSSGKAQPEQEGVGSSMPQKLPEMEPPLAKIPIDQPVPIAVFFKFIDKLVLQHDTISSYKLSENLLLRANPWILDSLVNTDYYYQLSQGNFVYQQPKLLLLKPGDTILVPGPKTAAILLEKMARTWVDINIPAFEMRILEGDSLLFVCPVRVGKNQKKHLSLAGGIVDLRTRTGTGEIIRVNRNPLFLDPVTGKRFKFTRRDDGQTTYMPQIPWLEPSIDGNRYGQMMHPTTNPRTLGKAASNGCIGVSEADGWRLYYFAPLGTKVQIRYDLLTVLENGDTLRYEDIYRLRKSPKISSTMAGTGFLKESTLNLCLCDTMF